MDDYLASAIAQKSTAARKDVPGTLPVIENHPRTSVQGDGYPHKNSERPLDTEEGSHQSQVAGAKAGTQAPPVDTKPKRGPGRPRIVADRKAYKARKERERRARLKDQQP